MTEYTVRWILCVSAESPEEAVAIARDYMPATANSAVRKGTLFEVGERRPGAEWLPLDCAMLDQKRN